MTSRGVFSTTLYQECLRLIMSSTHLVMFFGCPEEIMMQWVFFEFSITYMTYTSFILSLRREKCQTRQLHLLNLLKRHFFNDLMYVFLNILK